MNKIFLTGHVKEISIEQRTLTAYASTIDRDRDNEVIMPEAWRDSTQKFQSVPLIWAHEYRVPPIGKASNFVIDQNGLKFTAKFAGTTSAEEIWGLYRDGFLDSFSVGFQPKTWEDGKQDQPSRTYLSVELLEISAVPVPANPHARVERDAVPMISWKSTGDFDTTEQKRGRVLSAANERKIKDAMTSLQDVLSSLGEEPQQDEYHGSEPPVLEPEHKGEPNTDTTSIDASSPELFAKLNSFLDALKEQNYDHRK